MITGSPATNRRAGTTPVGLTDAEAATLLDHFGPNSLPAQRPVTWPVALARQLADTVIVVLLVALVLTLLMGDYPDSAVIAGAIAVNCLLGARQEVRSSHALEALAAMTAPRAVVLREGSEREIPAAGIVPGDVLVLNAGDIVAADADVCTAHALLLDESSVTGESLPVDRGPGDPLSAATVVVRGRGTARVTHTGARSAVGRIGRALSDGSATLTPLQRQLSRLGRTLALAVTVASVAVAVLDLAVGRGVEYSITVAISLAVAAIPESLPAVVAVTLALAARRMVDAGVLVRKLAAVEALGSVTVLGTDKTGTLTEGVLAVTAVWTPDDSPKAQRRLLEAGVLCNDAGAGSGGHDDPLEVALVEFAAAAGLDPSDLRAQRPRTGEEPFDAATARMVTSHRSGARVQHVCKGSPEAVFALVGARTGPAREAAGRAARDGGRVLGVAERFDDGTDDGAWELLGLFVFADRPRDNAVDVVQAFRRAGVRPIMITGDHPGTAEAIARQVGILADDAGPQSVYARTTPEGKTELVRTLRDAGELVAMTGDGVNDAAALRAADVGVAMGLRGTEVARQAADLVLTRDDLGAMVIAIGEGRRAYDNLRRFLHYALAGGLAEILVMLVGPLLGLAAPLGPGQILWVNLVTHGLPGVAMGSEPAQADVLDRPPRRPGAALVDRIVGARIAVLASVVTAGTLGAALWARSADRPWQAYAFVTLGVAQLFIALALRPSWRARDIALLLAVVIDLALTVLAVRWAPLSELLRTDLLDARDLLWCALAALPAPLVAYLQTHRRARRTPGADAP